MKYKLILILFAFLLASCDRTNEQKNETHTHEDGTVHTNGSDEHVKPQQESFEVVTDSSITGKDTTHVCDETDNHDHYHEHNSKTIHKH
jgi:hypothetical protein